MSKSEIIEFNGIIFRRYPESENPTHRKYYTCNSNYYKKGIRNLHREIWKSHHGDIPKGYHIHHKDGNTFNNDISNLQSLSCREHHKFSKKMDEISMHKHLAKIRPLAIQWHKSKKGKIWHKQHAVDIQKNLKYKDRNCVLCGKLFKYKYSTARFCSNACFQKFTRDNGKWSEKRKCIICGKEYIKK